MQVAFVVDKQVMEAFGFSMVPEASVKLAGAPDCEAQDITITLQAARSWVVPGPLELTLPLQIKGGPAVLLTLKAVVVIPDLIPSASILDFGEVATAHCKVYTVQLHNQQPVPCEWSIKKPAVDSPKLKDWDFFVPEPSAGALLAAAVTLVEQANQWAVGCTCRKNMGHTWLSTAHGCMLDTL
jgi:hydrocephalus-inducing protein